jgi:hypothetical protein
VGLQWLQSDHRFRYSPVASKLVVNSPSFDQEAPLALTPEQLSLRKDIEDIASIVKMDHWNILNYRPSRRRTIILKQTKDKLIRGHVTFMYTLVDQLLTVAIWSYYEPRWVDRTFPQLWQMKQFRTFNHYLMEETFLLKKLSLVDAIRKVPKRVSSAISRINDVRNALAHTLFPEERRRYLAHKKVMYGKKGDQADIYSKGGIEKFTQDCKLVQAYLFRRVFGKKTLSL